MSREEARATLEDLAAANGLNRERIRRLRGFKRYSDGDNAASWLSSIQDNFESANNGINQVRELLL